MDEAPRVVAVIPARGGSKGVPMKNIREVGGRPLVAWSVEAAVRCPLVDRVVVSTDHEGIREAAVEAGAEAPFLRPADLSTDHASTESALQHAVVWLEEHEGWVADIVLFLQPTDIFRRQEWLDWVIGALLDEPDLDSAFMAYPTHKNYWRIDAGGTPVSLGKHGYGPRQTKEPVYREDTGLACATRAPLIKAGRRIGDSVRIFPAEGRAVSVDIHDPFDLWLAEEMITRWGQRPNG